MPLAVLRPQLDVPPPPPPPVEDRTPELVVEIDFTGNPTSTYFDTNRNDDGVISYYRFNSNTSLDDDLAVNAGVVNGLPTVVAGALPYDTDPALSFNGSSQDAYVPNSATIPVGAFSIEGWVKVSSFPGSTKDFVSKAGSFRIQMNSSGIILFTVKNDTASVTVQSTFPVSTGTWVFVVCTYDNATAKIYIDGSLDQAAAYTGGVEGTGQPIRFAGWRGATAPTLVSATSTFDNGGGVSNITIPAPASVAAGDLLVAQLFWGNNGFLTGVPAGWSLLSTQTFGSSRTLRMYYKVATASEPGSYTWNLSMAQVLRGAIARITGVDPVAPFANPIYGNVEVPSGSSYTTGAHVPNVDNSLVLSFFCSISNNITWTESFGTEAWDFQGMAMSFGAVASASSTTVTGTPNSGADMVGHTLIVSGTGLNYTACMLDEFSLLNRVLTANEIGEHYQSRLAGVGSWVNVGQGGSGDVRSAATRVGRQYELNRMEAGTGSVPLKNQHRRYDPANTSSPYYPNVKPNRKIRIRALLDGVYYPLFKGFIERWPPQWDVPNYDEVKITVADGFKPLALAGVTGTLPTALSGSQIATVLSKARWPAADRNLDPGLFTMAQTNLDVSAKALNEIQEIADSELGIFFVDAQGFATFHDRSHRWLKPRSVTSQATFSDQGNFISYRNPVGSTDDDNTINTWLVTTAAGNTQTASDPVAVVEQFPRTQTRSTRLDNPSDALTQAGALLQQTAKPAFRFGNLTLRLTPATPQAVWVKAFTLQISDRVTVIANPVPAANGSLITKDFFIEGIDWMITPDVWDVSYQLSPVSSASYYDTIVRDGPVSYWRMDTTT